MKALLIAITTFLAPLVGFTQTDPCTYSCNQACRDYADQMAFRLAQINRGCGFPSNPGNAPRSRVEFFNSDTCSGDLIGAADPSSNCEKFRGAARAWAVQFNGKCFDINDTDAVGACYAHRSAAQPNAIYYFSSDNCTGELMASSAPGDDCKLIGKYVSSTVWAVEINGVCRDIIDTTFTKACDSLSLMNTSK